MKIFIDTERRIVRVGDVEMSFAALEYYSEVHQSTVALVALQQVLRDARESQAKILTH